MTSLLCTRGLAAGYNGHPIVRGLDLEVGAGEVVALLGPNGAGKTTTLLTLAGDLRQLDGDTTIAGDATSAPLHVRAGRGLAFVSDERAVFMGLTVQQNCRISDVDHTAVLELFPELEPRLRVRAGMLSGGEQQMLALGRALARRPQLLLADELSLGLAPLIVTRLLDAVRAYVDATGAGALLVEQHARQALRVADRVLVMRDGRVVLEGTPAEVKGRLEAAYLSA
jgi:branched-chain amino acid transport system ATP-binding protein